MRSRPQFTERRLWRGESGLQELRRTDEKRTPEKTVDVVDLGDGVKAARFTMEPGWRWSECVKPVVGTDRCQVRHVGAVLSGRMLEEQGVRMETWKLGRNGLGLTSKRGVGAPSRGFIPCERVRRGARARPPATRPGVARPFRVGTDPVRSPH